MVAMKDIYVTSVGTGSSTSNVNGENYITTANGGDVARLPAINNYPSGLLTITLIVSGIATLVMCCSAMTDHWEHVTWNVSRLTDICKTTDRRNLHEYVQLQRVTMERLFFDRDKDIVRISIGNNIGRKSNDDRNNDDNRNVNDNNNNNNNNYNINYYNNNYNNNNYDDDNDDNKFNDVVRNGTNPRSEFCAISDNHIVDKNVITKQLSSPFESESESAVYLLTMHGGIWNFCADLAGKQLELVKSAISYSLGDAADKASLDENCVHYLSMHVPENETDIIDWNHRMQNLSISCVLVCFIILSCSALVGSFGILKKQLSAILVTGVMYLLAGIFGFFPLMIIYIKRNDNSRVHHQTYRDVYGKQVLFFNGVISQTGYITTLTNYTRLWTEFYPARIFTAGWSMYLGWIAVTLSVIASLLWIALSKVMRKNAIAYV